MNKLILKISIPTLFLTAPLLSHAAATDDINNHNKNSFPVFKHMVKDEVYDQNRKLVTELREGFSRKVFLTDPQRFNLVIDPVISLLNLDELKLAPALSKFKATEFSSREEFSRAFYDLLLLNAEFNDLPSSREVDDIIGLELYVLRESKFYNHVATAVPTFAEVVIPNRAMSLLFESVDFISQLKMGAYAENIFRSFIVKLHMNLKKLKISLDDSQFDDLILSTDFIKNLVVHAVNDLRYAINLDIWEKSFEEHSPYFMYNLFLQDRGIRDFIYKKLIKDHHYAPSHSGPYILTSDELSPRRRSSFIFRKNSKASTSTKTHEDESEIIDPQIFNHNSFKDYFRDNFSGFESFRDIVYQIIIQNAKLASLVDLNVLLNKEATINNTILQILNFVQNHFEGLTNLSTSISNFTQLTEISVEKRLTKLREKAEERELRNLSSTPILSPRTARKVSFIGIDN